MPSDKCIVLNCPSGRNVRKHYFPKNDLEFRIWVKRTGNDKIINLSKEEVIKKYSICTLHFQDSCRSIGTVRLNKGSLPTMFLPNLLDTDEPQSNINLEVSKVVEYSSFETSFNTLAIPLDKSHEFSTSTPCSSKSSLYEVKPITNNSTSEIVIRTPKIRKNLLRDEGFIKSSQLTPIKRKFYKEVVKLKAKVQRMSNSKASLKSKLCVAKKFIKSNIYKGFQEKINKTTLEFIESQVGNQHKKLNGRRYTLNDKIFALSIFKTSPKAYKFLSNIFALPCETTLNNLLEKIPFIPGINSHIEENMKHQVKQLKPMDRTCIILFDEMALEPGLKYDKKNDLMLGFENFGKTVTNKFADHVLVFMIKGVSKKWKQPYAYYFCQGTTKTNQPMFQNNKLKDSDGTADLLLFVDKTFDSLNASRSIPDASKPLSGAIKIESEDVHLNHWNQAIRVFQSMKFIDKITKKSLARQPPCINNWVMTLKSFKYLWYKLKNKHNFKYLLTRNINQDSLEVLFGNIRSHSYRNTNPDCYHFVSSFKTLLINNFSSVKLIGNCELDESDNVLNNLKQFITGLFFIYVFYTFTSYSHLSLCRVSLLVRGLVYG
ncbi:hypothetical protein ACI65C_008736 [Semiaphis heraclei]